MIIIKSSLTSVLFPLPSARRLYEYNSTFKAHSEMLIAMSETDSCCVRRETFRTIDQRRFMAVYH